MKDINLKIMRPNGFHQNIENIVQKVNKNVTNKSGWKIIKQCPLCLSKKNENWLVKNKIIIKNCLSCGLGYSTKQPKNLSDVYNLKSEIIEKKKTYKRRAKYFTKKFGKERIKFIKKFKKKGRLLDFGCGTGEFANLAKFFFNTEVFDYSKSLTDFVNKNYNLKSYNEIKKIKQKFDVITMYDVIEHLPDPKKTINQLKEKLNVGGVIVLYTPHKDSFAFEVKSHYPPKDTWEGLSHVKP